MAPASRAPRRTRRRRSNPLILSNPAPRRRRRRRRNPAKLKVKTILMDMLTYSAGSSLAYVGNQFVLRRIEHDWGRRAAQVATAVAGSMFLPDKMGAAFAGAAMYPLLSDLALTVGVVGPADQGVAELAADLEAILSAPELSADLQGVEEMYLDGYPAESLL